MFGKDTGRNQDLKRKGDYMEKSTETLYIPTNIATRFEFLPGLGMWEAILGAAAGAVAALVSYLFLSFYSGLVLTIIIAVGTTMTFMKNEINMSIADHINAAVRFAKGQKKYDFIWYDRFTEGGAEEIEKN